jgi:RimJ/RimL family protein N-acetyltransferase
MIQFSGPIFRYPLDYEQLQAYLAGPNRLIYKVIDTENNNVIGHAELNNIDFKNESARICRVLIGNPEDRNKGYGKQIIKKLLQIGFDELKLHRIDLGVFEFNTSAIACYKSCGFVIEGLLKESYKIANQFVSGYNMAILAHEYERIKNS